MVRFLATPFGRKTMLMHKNAVRVKMWFSSYSLKPQDMYFLIDCIFKKVRVLRFLSVTSELIKQIHLVTNCYSFRPSLDVTGLSWTIVR